MKKAFLAIFVIVLLMVLTGCGNNSIVEPTATVKPTSTPKPQMEPTSLYEDIFVGLSKKVGKYTFSECKEYVKSKGYSGTISEPTATKEGLITIADNNGFILTIHCAIGSNNVETLCLLSYAAENNAYSASVSDFYGFGNIKYQTYDIGRERRAVYVNSIDDITDFIFGIAVYKLGVIKTSLDDADEIEVGMKLQCNYNSGCPIFQIITNLPDGTEVLLILANDYKDTAYETVYISNGIGKTSPFSINNKPITNGLYRLFVCMTVPSQQSENVQLKIGTNGEKLIGSMVKKSDSLGNYVDIIYDIKVNNESMSIGNPYIDND